MAESLESRKKRVKFLRETEGCCLCKMNVATDRYYERANSEQLLYHKDADGDYLLCPWHDAIVKYDWRNESDLCKRAIKCFLEERSEREQQENRF